MTNEIKTRRLIVTLPDCSGEEVDSIITDIEMSGGGHGLVNRMPGARVRHALGETLPIHMSVRQSLDMVRLDTGYLPRVITQSEARSLAGALLAVADQLAEGTPS